MSSTAPPKGAPAFDPTKPYTIVGKGHWEGYEQNGMLYETNGKPKGVK